MERAQNSKDPINVGYYMLWFRTLHCTSNRCILFMFHLTLFLSDHPMSERIDLTHFWLLHIIPQNGNAIVCLTISGLFRLFLIFCY